MLTGEWDGCDGWVRRVGGRDRWVSKCRRVGAQVGGWVGGWVSGWVSGEAIKWVQCCMRPHQDPQQTRETMAMPSPTPNVSGVHGSSMANLCFTRPGRLIGPVHELVRLRCAELSDELHALRCSLDRVCQWASCMRVQHSLAHTPGRDLRLSRTRAE
jgi:hypothetical protein